MDSLEAKAMKENGGSIRPNVESSNGGDLEGYTNILFVSPFFFSFSSSSPFFSSLPYKLTQLLNLLTSSKTEGSSCRVAK